MTESDIYQLVGEAYCAGMGQGMEKQAGDSDKIRKLLGQAKGGGISMPEFYQYILGKEGFQGTNLSETKLRSLVQKMVPKGQGINKFLLDQARAYVDGVSPAAVKDLAPSVIENIQKQAPAMGEATGILRPFGNGRKAPKEAVKSVEESLLRPRGLRRVLPEESFNELMQKMPHLHRGIVDKKTYSKALTEGAPKLRESAAKAVADIVNGNTAAELISKAPTVKPSVLDAVPQLKQVVETVTPKATESLAVIPRAAESLAVIPKAPANATSLLGKLKGKWGVAAGVLGLGGLGAAGYALGKDDDKSKIEKGLFGAGGLEGAKARVASLFS